MERARLGRGGGGDWSDAKHQGVSLRQQWGGEAGLGLSVELTGLGHPTEPGAQRCGMVGLGTWKPSGDRASFK